MSYAFEVAFVIASEFCETGGFQTPKHKYIQASQLLGFGSEITPCSQSSPPSDEGSNGYSGEQIDQVIVHDRRVSPNVK